MAKIKIKKFKSGKIKRHKFKKKLGLKQGFGKPWSAPSVSFRVEFRWEDEDGNEENDQIHWIDCRKFQGAEREFLKIHYNQSSEQWTPGETIESKFVCFYCVNFLIENKEKLHLNQAFIYSSPKKGNDTIRIPIYHLKCDEKLAAHQVEDDTLKIVMQNAIWHHSPNETIA